jgi:hypothetical protein
MTLRDRETLELLRDDPELLALADAVADTQRPRRRVPRRALAVAAVLVAAAILALAAPWEDEGGNGLVLERALAAVQGDGPVVHSVVTMRDARRVELATGRVSYRETRIEAWYDRERRRARLVARQDGRLLGDEVVTVGTPDPTLETFAPAPTDLSEFYRGALRDGRARILREGDWEGRPVYWLELDPPKGGSRGAHVAVDRETYLPQVMTILDERGRPTDFQFRFLTLETIPRRERDFEGAENPGGLLTPGSFSAEGSSGPISLESARSTLGSTAVWAGQSIAGSRFREVAVTDLESEPGSADAKQGKGLKLAYGTSLEEPPVRGITIDQIRDDSPLRESVVDGEPPREGVVELREHTIGWSAARETKRITAVLRRDGLWIAIDAPNEETALTVARALRPIP